MSVCPCMFRRLLIVSALFLLAGCGKPNVCQAPLAPPAGNAVSEAKEDYCLRNEAYLARNLQEPLTQAFVGTIAYQCGSTNYELAAAYVVQYRECASGVSRKITTPLAHKDP